MRVWRAADGRSKSENENVGLSLWLFTFIVSFRGFLIASLRFLACIRFGFGGFVTMHARTRARRVPSLAVTHDLELWTWAGRRGLVIGGGEVLCGYDMHYFYSYCYSFLLLGQFFPSILFVSFGCVCRFHSKV